MAGMLRGGQQQPPLHIGRHFAHPSQVKSFEPSADRHGIKREGQLTELANVQVARKIDERQWVAAGRRSDLRSGVRVDCFRSRRGQ